MKEHMNQTITQWHQLARPNPTEAHFNVQFGCHLEEIAEMLEEVTFHTQASDFTTTGKDSAAYHQIKLLADMLKAGEATAEITDRVAFLDSLADQNVTASGTAHCANMDYDGAIEEVNRSNWSKFVRNQPVFKANGKIDKGPDYSEPNLEQFV